MQLSLEGVNKRVGPQTWLHDMSIAPRSGAVTVLLGATQAGKTSLMRIMAGLDVPTTGRVLVDGRDVVVSVPLSKLKPKQPISLEVFRWSGGEEPSGSCDPALVE